MTPVFKQLQAKYPRMFGSPSEAQKAAQALAADAHLVALLHEEFDKNFRELKEGEDVILTVLAQQNEKLQEIAEIGVSVQETTVEGFKQLPIDIKQAIKEALQEHPIRQPLSLPEIDIQISNLLLDAGRWLYADNAPTAQRRLDEAGALIAEGLNKGGDRIRFFEIKGYLEKLQYKVNVLARNPEAALAALNDAAEYFAAALKLDPSNAGSLNGLGGVYYEMHQYDAAITFAELSIEESTKKGFEYPSAFTLVRDSILGKMQLASGHDFTVERLKQFAAEDRSSAEKLKDILEKLVIIVPKHPEEFTLIEHEVCKKQLMLVRRALDETAPV
jgi:tetratricopeptide (TPR) repeat protein